MGAGSLGWHPDSAGRAVYWGEIIARVGAGGLKLGGLGCGCGLIAVLVALITAIPLLGWGNWILTLPAAVLAIVFSLVGLARDDRRDTAVLGLILGVTTLFWAMFRLALGGGVF